MNFNVNYSKCLTWMQRDLSSALIEPTGHASQENCHTPDWLLLNFPVGQVWQRPKNENKSLKRMERNMKRAQRSA